MSLIKRMFGLNPGPVLDAGFRRVEGRHYLDVLGDLHAKLKPDWYLEIGTQKGKSLVRARCKSIAIDPQFQLSVDVFKVVPEVHMFSATSDDFFATDFLRRNDVQISLAFLDGMHLFEYLLRDFINTERFAAKEAVITVHDCVPQNRQMSSRDWDRKKTRQWTGDVWKLLPILRKYRPDLEIKVLDCAPTGLVAIRCMKPDDRTLGDNLSEIVAEWSAVELEGYGLDRFAADFPLEPNAQYLAKL